jgi:hypothetical protein
MDKFVNKYERFIEIKLLIRKDKYNLYLLLKCHHNLISL